MNALADTARQFAALGFRPIAIDGDKKPLGKWKDGNPPQKWQHAQHIALVMGAGDLVCLDFDKQDRRALDETLAALGLSAAYDGIEQTPGGGWHLFILSRQFPLNGTGRKDRPGLYGGHIEMRYQGVLTTRYSARLAALAVVDPAVLIAAYDAVTIAPPEPERFVSKEFVSLHPDGTVDLLEQYLSECDRAAVETFHLKHRAGKRYSDNFSLRSDDRQPSAGYDFEKHGIKDFGGGSEFIPWTELYKHIPGLPSWDQYRADHRVANLSLHKGQEGVTAPIRAFDSLPYTVLRLLMDMGQAAAALVLFEYPDLADTLGEWFFAGEYQRASADGRGQTRRQVEGGFAQLEALEMVETACTKCNRLSCNTEVLAVAKCTCPDRTPRAIRFLPIAEQLHNLYRKAGYHQRMRLFRDIPDNVQPEYADLTTDEIDLLDAVRAPVYAQHEADRTAALDRFETFTGYRKADGERILEGRYRAVKIPPGRISNVPAFRRALADSIVPEDGVLENAQHEIQKITGLSSSAVSRVKRDIGLITEERTKAIPAADVRPSQRAKGLVISETAGTAIIRLPSAAKRADKATDEERRAHEQLCQRQSARAAIRAQRSPARQHSEHETLTHFDATAEKAGAVATADTVPAAYSEDHSMRQFEYTPGADGILRYPVDTETGEIDTEAPYTPAFLWRQVLDQMRAERTEVQPQAQEYGEMRQNAVSEPPADNNLVIEKKDAPFEQLVTEAAPIGGTSDEWPIPWRSAFWSRMDARGITATQVWAHTGVCNAKDFFAAFTPTEAGQLLDQLAPRAA